MKLHSVAVQSLAGAVAVCGALVGCGGPGIEDSSPKATAKVAKYEPGESLETLTEDVADLTRRLIAPRSVFLAEELEINRVVWTEWNKCLSSEGYISREWLDVPISGDSGTPIPQSPTWYRAPVPELANGVGVHDGPDAKLVWRDSPDPNVFDSAKATEKYDEVGRECFEAIEKPQPFDWSRFDAIRNGAEVIFGHTLEQAEEFRDLEARYAACVSAAGFAFQSPDGIQQSALLLTGPEAAQVERQMTRVDVDCRAPLYEEFIGLRAEDWRVWVNENEAEVAAIERDWAALSATLPPG
jgi:hypothetical protein